MKLLLLGVLLIVFLYVEAAVTIGDLVEAGEAAEEEKDESNKETLVIRVLQDVRNIPKRRPKTKPKRRPDFERDTGCLGCYTVLSTSLDAERFRRSEERSGLEVMHKQDELSSDARSKTMKRVITNNWPPKT